MSAPEDRGFLLLRRAGGVWGIANAAVERLSAAGGGFRISVGALALVADEIVGVVAELSVRPPAAVLRRYWDEAPAGLAVHGGLPVVVLDPRRLPAALRLEPGDGTG